MGAPGVLRAAQGAAALVCAVALLAWSDEAAIRAPAQDCEAASYARSTPADRFEDLGEGSIADRRLGLVWQRCAVGQVWAQDRCAGKALVLNWSQARQLAAELNTGGAAFFDNWRLPRMNELASIVERQCATPRIDLHLFPDTPAAAFWSATPAANGAAASAYVLSFGMDGAGHDDVEARHFVRLVRDGP